MAVTKTVENSKELPTGKGDELDEGALDGSTDVTPKKPLSTSEKLSIFAKIALFFKQIVNEMKKVVYPTREEVIRYTIVVLVFVLVLMGFITAIDFGLGKLVTLIFGN
jgi:preprotein translocase subunit SecE